MIDKNHDSRIDYNEFETIMIEKISNDLYHGHSVMHEIKKQFKKVRHTNEQQSIS
jgi:hypothetical protein